MWGRLCEKKQSMDAICCSLKMHQMPFVSVSKEINTVLVAHDWGPGTWKSEERGLPQDQGQPELQRFFKILPINK